jgi:hypothetical protein
MAEINAVAPVLPQVAPAAPAAPVAPAPADAGPALGATPAATPATPATPADKNAVTPGTGTTSSVSLPGSSSSEPPPSSSSTEAPKVQGNKFSSVGDPHETTGDGLHFDNQQEGDFIKMHAKSGDFEVQTRQGPWDKNPQAKVNTMVGVKVNSQDDKVVYDAKTKQMTFNGKPIEVKPGEDFQIPGGGSVSKTPDGYEIKSAKGDKVDLKDRGNYVDMTGEVSPDRADGDVVGSLGRFDADTDWRNDLEGRDGKQLNSTDDLINDWKVKPGEGMFDGGAKPADAGAKPADPGAKPAEVGKDGKPADPNAKPADANGAPAAADAKKPPTEEDLNKLLATIKDMLTKLLGDPAMAQDKKDQLKGLNDKIGGIGANGVAEKPQADALNQAANEAKPDGNAAYEKLLEILKQYLEALGQFQDAKKGNAAPAPAPAAAPAPAKA